MTNAMTKRGGNPLAALHSKFDESRYTLLLPKTHLAELPAGTQLSVREVTVDSRDIRQGGSTYGVDGGKRGLNKTALNQIANAAGIVWDSIQRTDPRNHPHYCEVEAKCHVTDFDGTVRHAVGTKTLDFRRDAAGGIAGKDLASMESAAKKRGRDPSGQIDQARKFISEICASKAMNRAIADILGIKRAYTTDELAKPFVVPKLVPDTSDPQVKDLTLASMMGATHLLYGAPKEPKPIIEGEVVESDLSTPTSADRQDPVGGLDAPPTGSAPPLPEDDEEPWSEAQARERLTQAWGLAHGAGMSGIEWKAMQANTVGKPVSEMSRDDVGAIEDVIEKYLDSKGGRL